MPSSVRKEASAILHAHVWVRQFWRPRVSPFQPSERPRSCSTVVDITRCGVPGLVCVADRNSSSAAVTTSAGCRLAACVSRRTVPSAAPGVVSRVDGRRPLSTGDLFHGRRMTDVPMMTQAAR